MPQETQSTALQSPSPADVWPDVHSSTEAYARRFSGAAGDYLLSVQQLATLKLLEPWRGGKVLDVGGGHAQLVGPLAAAGFDVTVLGSHDSCFDRVRSLAGCEHVTCVVGDLEAPPLEPRSFDVVVAFRMLPHVANPTSFLDSLCCWSRHAVIVEYPALASVNLLSPLFFRLKRRLEGNTRPYRLFRTRRVRRTLALAGFGTATKSTEFFWPIGLHRLLGRPTLSCLLEAVPRWTGLSQLVGSPVILRATRTGSCEAGGNLERK